MPYVENRSIYLLPEIHRIIKDVDPLDLKKCDPTIRKVDIKDTISNKQMKKDMALFLRGFIYGYVGFPFLDHKKQKLMQKQFLEIYKDDIKRISIDEFNKRIKKVIYRNLKDNHIFSRINIKGKKKKSNAITKDPIGGNLAKDEVCKAFIKTVNGKKCCIVAIKNLNKGGKHWKKLKEDFYKKVKNADCCIIDIRENTGGDSRHINFLIEYLYGCMTPYAMKQVMRHNLETKILRSNKGFKGYCRIKGKKFQTYLKNSIAELKSNKEFITVLNYTSKKDYPKFDKTKGYNKPIYLLQNRRTASSAEGVFMMLHNHPKLITIGQNTSGCTHFGDCISFNLPNSKLNISFGSIYREHYQGFVETTGFKPKIYVKDGNDAFKKLRNII